jgi:dihydroflavonol-4-reductase
MQGQALVTGASGFVGYHVARRLVERGVRVRCLVRPSSKVEPLKELGVELASGDITDQASVERAADGCDYLFHVAAAYTFWSKDPAEIYRSNVEGTRIVLRAGRKARRIVYTSTVGALGNLNNGTPSDETTPVSIDEMVGHYKRSKFQAQEVALNLAKEGLPVVIVNPSAPVGPYDFKPTPTGQMILDYMKGRMKAYVNTGLNLVAVEDVAEGHILAAERGRVGEMYILGNKDMHLREIFQVLAKLTGIAAPSMKVPHWLPLTVAAFSTAKGKLLGRPPKLPLEQVRLSTKMMYFSPAKAVRELGMPQTPPEDALERAVRWFRDNGYATR